MSIGRAIAANTIWMILGKVIVTGAALVLTGILTRTLGVYGYGEFSTAFAYMVFFNVVADFGFYQILVREVAKRSAHKDQERVANTIWTMRILFALVVFSLAAVLVFTFPYSLTVKLGVVVLSAVSFFATLNNTIIAIFQAHERMDRAVISDVANRLFLLVAVMLVAPLGWSVPAILVLYALASLVGLVINLVFVRPFHTMHLSYNRAAWGKLFQETWTLGLVSVLIVLYFKIDSVILSLLKTPLEVGIYAVPYKILEVILFLPSMFTGNILPALTRLLRESKDQLQRLVQVSFDALLIVAVGATIGMAVLAPAIVRLIAGEEFVVASSYTLTFGDWSQPVTAPHLLVILALAMSFIFMVHLWSIVLIAAGKQNGLIKPAVVALIINIVLNLIFIPRGSYLAAAVITLVTEAYVSMAAAKLALREVPVQLSFVRTGKALLAGVVMAAVIWPLRTQSLLVTVMAGTAVYGAILALLGTFPPRTWSFIWPTKQGGPRSS